VDPGPRVIDWVALVRVGRDFLRRLRGAQKGFPNKDSGFLEKGIHPACISYLFAFSPNRLRLFAFVLLCSPLTPPHTPWLRLVTLSVSSLREHSTWCAACSDGARRHRSSQRSRRRGVRVVHLLHLLRVGAADLALLLTAAGGVRTSASAPHAPIHPLGGHLRPPLRDVRRCGPCTSLFRHFFVLVKSVAEPPKLLGPHAPVLVSKTSDCYACAPDNLTGSVRLPQGHRINHLQPEPRD
jgi:hypothetical protein